MPSKSFESALNAPFSAGALGAQIPDLSGYPTDTRHFRQSFTYTADANGNGEFMLFGSPFLSIASKPLYNGSLYDPITGGIQLSRTIGSSTTGPNVLVPAAVFNDKNTVTVDQDLMCIHQTAQTTDMANLFSMGRVVGWGFKIRALGALTAIQGRVQIAALPNPITLPNVWNLEKNSNAGYPVALCYANVLGVGSTLYNSDLYNNNTPANASNIGSTFTGAILDFPFNAEVTAVQLANGPLKGHGKIVSRDFEKYRQFAGAPVVDEAVYGANEAPYIIEDPSFTKSTTSVAVTGAFNLAASLTIAAGSTGTQTYSGMLWYTPSTAQRALTPGMLLTSGSATGIITAVTPSSNTAGSVTVLAFTTWTAVHLNVQISGMGSELANHSLNTYNSGYMSACDCGGWSTVLVGMLGAGAAAKFEVEVIYHIEGVPKLNIGNSSLSGNSAMNKSGLGGSAARHSPIEAMAAEMANAHSGKNLFRVAPRDPPSLFRMCGVY